MADTTPSDSPLASDRVDSKFNPYNGGEHSSWTEALPHDFKGWGPQTPDLAEETKPGMQVGHDDLHWDGDEESQRHIVWRFDRPRRH